MNTHRPSLWLQSALPFLLLAISLSAQEAQRPFIFEADVKAPMRDGVNLAANIFRPKGDGPFPVILMRTPYGKMDEKMGDGKRYAAAGYAMVVQDCRGRGKSEGVWDPFRYDAQDGYDTQEWIGHQSWCNGSIGTAGGSYVGWTQWAPAAKSSRYLKAMVPIVPFGNAYELAYSGGAFQLALLMGWGTAVGSIALSPDKLQEAFRHLPLRTFAEQFDNKVPYLDDWVAHYTYDDYWKARGIDYRYADVTIPILNIGGWYDIFSKVTLDLVTQVRSASTDREVRRNEFVVIGPWTHGVGAKKVGELDFGSDAGLNLGDLQFKWFEYWLKGRETGVQDWPAYYLFVMGENRWRGENEWPLKRTRSTSYFLHSAGHAATLKGDGLLNAAEPGDEPTDQFTYDGNNPVPLSRWQQPGGCVRRPARSGKSRGARRRAGVFHCAAGAGHRGDGPREVDSLGGFQRPRHRLYGQAGGRPRRRQGLQLVRWNRARPTPQRGGQAGAAGTRQGDAVRD